MSVDISTNTRSIYRPSSGRHIDRVGQVSVEYRLSAGHLSADIAADMCVSQYRFSLIDTRRYLIDTLPMVCRYLTDMQSKLGLVRRPSDGGYSANQVSV